MKYESYEKMIIDRLSCQELEVRTKELNDDELNRFRQAKKPVVYVMYQGSDYSEPEELGVIAQKETMAFDIIIFARTQRGKTGVYSAFETVTKRLLGYREKGMRTPVIFQKFGYAAKIDDTYQYALQCSFTGYIVESDRQEENVPLITGITNNIQS